MPLSQVKPEQYQQQLEDKVALLKTRLAPFTDPDTPWTVVQSAPTGYRLRAEFRVWHDGDDLNYVMFRKGEPETPVIINEFPIASPIIQALMPTLIAELRTDPILRRRLFQVEFLSSLSGDMVVTLAYHRKLDEAWLARVERLANSLQINVVGRSRRQKLIIGKDYVDECLKVAERDFHYRQYEQAFTQPNGEVNREMIDWALARASDIGGDLLELYCGNGNFTLPLATRFRRVLATEVAKSSIAAARHNAVANKIDNIDLVRLSAEEVAQALAGERDFRRLRDTDLSSYEFSCVFVDPPRTGLDAHTESMVSAFPHILYVSCNPETLCQNLVAISRSHRVAQAAVFDQFPYTEHLECAVLLRRR